MLPRKLRFIKKDKNRGVFIQGQSLEKGRFLAFVPAMGVMAWGIGSRSRRICNFRITHSGNPFPPHILTETNRETAVGNDRETVYKPSYLCGINCRWGSPRMWTKSCLSFIVGDHVLPICLFTQYNRIDNQTPARVVAGAFCTSRKNHKILDTGNEAFNFCGKT